MSTVKSSDKSPPAELRSRPIIRRKIWDRVHKEDKNYMCIVCGQTGEGKSEFGLRLCQLLDPDFTVDQVAFELDDFMRLVEDRSYGEGSAILFDEVGVALDAATHYDQDQLKINRILQTWREQNRILVMTAPHIRLIQKKSRGLLHGQFDMKDINLKYHMSTAFYRHFSQDTDTGEVWKKNPRLRDPSDHATKQFQTVSLFKPSPDIVEPYQEKKIEFNNRLNQQVKEEVMPDDDELAIDPDEKLSPREVAQEIVAEDAVDEVVSVHGGNGTEYVDADLIQMDYQYLSTREAKKVKKALEREVSV